MASRREILSNYSQIEGKLKFVNQPTQAILSREEIALPDIDIEAEKKRLANLGFSPESISSIIDMKQLCPSVSSEVVNSFGEHGFLTREEFKEMFKPDDKKRGFSVEETNEIFGSNNYLLMDKVFPNLADQDI